ncbi:hypothetical protein GCM10011297_09470 [Bacterioplanes sanyensis]|uniref:hypothetical protein n=1 Tax=Bacterioplanes sanyensis TaxID=1249553 RepID=UPI001671CCA0|nr:hypothetical protein [Bacterioplanes sanyensis]GGY38407.1 hypothetical protein GCM10011297_09470 [Bacterioplanes sanyensis]
MQLGALTSYLQNQPAASSAAPQAPDSATGKDEPKPGDYQFSTRALMVSAVAQEFDVEAIPRDQLGQFQARLQQYGLLQGSNLNAMAVISAGSPTNDAEAGTPTSSVDALQRVTEARQQFELNQTPYSDRQRINQLHTLLQNMKSARAGI